MILCLLFYSSVYRFVYIHMYIYICVCMYICRIIIQILDCAHENAKYIYTLVVRVDVICEVQQATLSIVVLSNILIS